MNKAKGDIAIYMLEVQEPSKYRIAIEQREVIQMAATAITENEEPLLTVTIQVVYLLRNLTRESMKG